MLGPEGGRLRDPTSVEEKNETFFIKMWQPLLPRHILKTLRENPKRKPQNESVLLQKLYRKTQREQYLLVMSLYRYKNNTKIKKMGSIKDTY